MQLKNTIKTEKIELPSFPGSEVEVKSELLVEEVMQVREEEDEMGQAMKFLEMAIVKWNFDDEEGRPLPVNKENLGKLPAKDFEKLVSHIVPIKKNFEKTK